MNFWLEIIGFTAGSLVVLSTVQRVWYVIKSPKLALNEDSRRNLLQCIGNVLLFIYAAALGGLALPMMCAISAAMTVYLFRAKITEENKIIDDG